MNMNDLRGYHRIIAEAIGVQPTAILEEVEDIMRHSIFHSTLDWQTREQLHTAAREGFEIYQIMQNPARMRQILMAQS